MKAEVELKTALEAYIGHVHQEGERCSVDDCCLAQALTRAADEADAEMRQVRLTKLHKQVVSSFLNEFYAKKFEITITDNHRAWISERVANLLSWLPGELRGEGE